MEAAGPHRHSLGSSGTPLACRRRSNRTISFENIRDRNQEFGNGGGGGGGGGIAFESIQKKIEIGTRVGGGGGRDLNFESVLKEVEA